MSLSISTLKHRHHIIILLALSVFFTFVSPTTAWGDPQEVSIDDSSATRRVWAGSWPIFEEIADFRLLETLSSDDPEQHWSLSGVFGTQAWIPLGLGVDREGMFSASASLGFGAYFSPGFVVQLRSQVIAPFQASQEGVQEDWGLEALKGDHRLLIRSGLGGFSKGALGADLELDARLTHVPDGQAHVTDASIGPAGHHDTDMTARLWLRRGMGDEAGWVLPFGFHWRNLDYWGGEGLPLSGFESQGLSSGLGMRPYMRHASGWVEFVGVEWSRTDLNHNRPCFPDDLGVCRDLTPTKAPHARASQLQSVNKLDLKVFAVEELSLLVEEETRFNPHFSLGGTWLWDEHSGQENALFTLAWGGAMRFPGGSSGLVFSRRGGFDPSGQRLTADWRIEVLAEAFIEEAYMGGAFRGAFNWSEDLAHDISDQTFVAHHQTHSEWFFELFEGGVVGAYYENSIGLSPENRAWDPQQQDPRWRHEVGGFFRVGGDL